MEARLADAAARSVSPRRLRGSDALYAALVIGMQELWRAGAARSPRVYG